MLTFYTLFPIRHVKPCFNSFQQDRPRPSCLSKRWRDFSPDSVPNAPGKTPLTWFKHFAHLSPAREPEPNLTASGDNHANSLLLLGTLIRLLWCRGVLFGTWKIQLIERKDMLPLSGPGRVVCWLGSLDIDSRFVQTLFCIFVVQVYVTLIGRKRIGNASLIRL